MSKSKKKDGTYSPYMISFAKEGDVDVLTVGFGSRTSNDVNCRDIEMQLNELRARGILKGGNLIKISGPGSVHTSSTVTGFLSQFYAAIAVFEPRLKGEKQFIITFSRGQPHSNYKVGETIK